MFTQTTAQTMNSNGAAQAAAWAMMPCATQTCSNQQITQTQQSQRQQTQSQYQDARAKSIPFAQAESDPVFCFFYTYKPSRTHFTKQSKEIVQRPEEILNHAHKGGARI